MYSIQRTSTCFLLAVLAIALVAAAGCSGSVDALPVADSPVIAATPAVAEASDKPLVAQTSSQALPTSDAGVTDDASIEEPATPAPDGEGPPAPTVAEYQPPFPDRVDLFVPPKRIGGVRSKEGESEDAIELLGFVRVDRQRVVLSINGEVHPLYEGASQFGIEVISIQPPNVVLQRGRQRWQASLEN